MKKKALFILAAMMLCFCAYAQGINGYRQAIGIRGGWGAEISYQRYVAPENRFEGTIGINRFGFSVEGVYQWMYDIAADVPGELKWYAGGGAGLGAWSNKDFNTGFSAGILGQAGIEYSFANVPLMLSVDYRPGFYFVPEFRFDWSGFALGIRYCF
jgi:hypothetical protein